MSNFSAISWCEQDTFDAVHFVLDQHEHAISYIFYNESSLKQQSAGRYAAPFVIQSQSVFALTPECYSLSGESRNTKCTVFGSTRPGLESTIYQN